MICGNTEKILRNVWLKGWSLKGVKMKIIILFHHTECLWRWVRRMLGFPGPISEKHENNFFNLDPREFDHLCLIIPRKWNLSSIWKDPPPRFLLLKKSVKSDDAGMWKRGKSWFAADVNSCHSAMIEDWGATWWNDWTGIKRRTSNSSDMNSDLWISDSGHRDLPISCDWEHSPTSSIDHIMRFFDHVSHGVRWVWFVDS
jgi:hypothetical protein